VSEPSDDSPAKADFIRAIVAEDQRSDKHGGRVVTRFPPHPNGYLHIGHAKAICLNFGIAGENQGVCHLRFDDTNPTAEDVEFIESIKADVRWLGCDWGDHLYYASDYFDQLYAFAEQLIEKGKAYVCDLSSKEHRALRGTLTQAGTDSPFRSRAVDENLDLFRRLKAGEFESGARVLRAKIDMASPILPMRDPILYRIQRGVVHHRTGDKWHIYPLYDFAHCLSDSIEGITHSLCSLEFLDHRPLYDWVLDELGLASHPQQIEFARLNLSHTIMSKRNLKILVDDGHVSGWDDPRMPTLSGLRRRGYPAEAIRDFLDGIGSAKRDNTIELARLEFNVRDNLNKRAPRVMGVLDPLKVVIENFPEGRVEELEAVNNPEDASQGTRIVPFSRVLYIEREDFREDPPRKYFRLGPDREVRLRYGYFVTCVGFTKNDAGEVVEVQCTYDPETRGGNAPDGRRVKGTIHWVSAAHAVPATVRLYDHLFTPENPTDIDAAAGLRDGLNPNSLEELTGSMVGRSLAGASAGDGVQFERNGYFVVDRDSSAARLVFNRTATLRDTWAKIEKKMNA